MVADSLGSSYSQGFESPSRCSKPLSSRHYNICEEYTDISNLYHPLLVLIATATENELAKIIQYLKEENRIPREKAPERISLIDLERQRLVRFGLTLGAAIREVVTIVHHRTFQRWVAKTNGSASPRNTSNKVGRPRTQQELREMVVKIAKETGWGACRNCGEL